MHQSRPFATHGQADSTGWTKSWWYPKGRTKACIVYSDCRICQDTRRSQIWRWGPQNEGVYFLTTRATGSSGSYSGFHKLRGFVDDRHRHAAPRDALETPHAHPGNGMRCEIEGRLAHPNMPSVISLVTYQVSHSFCLHLSHEARETRRLERR